MTLHLQQSPIQVPDRYSDRYREVSAVAARQPAASPVLSAPPGISVIGLEQAGVVAVACLAHLGFPVIGVDIRADRTAEILDGNAPEHDPKLERLLLDGVRDGRIQTRQNAITAVLDTDVTLLTADCTRVAPGTGRGGRPEMLVHTSRAIGQALAMKRGYHVIVVAGVAQRGSLLETVVPELERASGKQLGEDFGLCCMPSFGRPQTTVYDFYSPTRTVVGTSDKRAASAVAGIVRLIDTNAIYTSIEAAEMAKRAEILWRATRSAFDAEIERFCVALDVDAAEVMDIFRASVRAAPSPARPAPTVARTGLDGRTELRDDLRAAARLGARCGVALPLLESLLAGDLD